MGKTYVRLIPLPERRSVDLDDRALDERVRAHELVVRGVVHDRDDPRLARHALRAPREVARVEAQRAELGVPAAHAHAVDALRPELRVRGLAPELELPLLAVVRALGARGGALVS